MLAALVIAIPVIVAAVIAAIVVLMTVMAMWAVLALVTWRRSATTASPDPGASPHIAVVGSRARGAARSAASRPGIRAPVTDHPALRASDSDRERVAEHLRQATAEGRLRAEELDERLGALFASRTYGELDRLVADLPEPAPPRSPEPHAVPVPVWVACVVSGSLMLAVLGLLVRGHQAAAVAGPRAPGAPQHVFFSQGPGASVATLFALVLAATLIAAAGWAYSRAAQRGSRRLSS